MKAEESFLFSLKSNGRLNGMLKFEQKNYCYGLYIYDKSNSYIFGLHDGFYICKENSKSSSNITEREQSFDFHGKSNIFLSNSGNGSWPKFTPKRFVVIQMK